MDYEAKYKRLFDLVHRMRNAQIEQELSPNMQARQFKRRIELVLDKFLRDELIERKQQELFERKATIKK